MKGGRAIFSSSFLVARHDSPADTQLIRGLLTPKRDRRGHLTVCVNERPFCVVAILKESCPAALVLTGPGARRLDSPLMSRRFALVSVLRPREGRDGHCSE